MLQALQKNHSPLSIAILISAILMVGCGGSGGGGFPTNPPATEATLTSIKFSNTSSIRTDFDYEILDRQTFEVIASNFDLGYSNRYVISVPLAARTANNQRTEVITSVIAYDDEDGLYETNEITYSIQVSPYRSAE